MYMVDRSRSLVDFLTWLGCKKGLVGFLVPLFALLSPLRDPHVYSLYNGGLPLGPYIYIYIVILLIKKKKKLKKVMLIKMDVAFKVLPFWIWRERNMIVFGNVDFSLSRLKSSFISMFVYWANCLELGDYSRENSFVYSLGLSFLVGRCWLFFV